jgi:Family of unknown function (DUF5343)
VGLSNKYTLAISRVPDIFDKIRDGQAPEQFTQQLLKDWGFTSSNDRVMLPLLKDLGFLSPDGKPTARYHDYRDHSRSKAVIADAIRNAYSDIFLIKEHPTETDRVAIQGKFKSFHNVSDHVASLMTRTFYALLKLSDLKAPSGKQVAKTSDLGNGENTVAASIPNDDERGAQKHRVHSPGLHYNIQIHLPASKDVEVYNAIFKSLREHLLEE